jgi:glycosyltransferase involved in cell wall biosynthesis
VVNIYHGIPVEKFEFNDKPGDHLVWLGRISPQKDTRGAIEVARRTGRKLILAGKIDKVDEEYYEEEVRPYIDGEQIHYIGELGFADKIGFLKDAWCMLMPLTWQEPFGLVMIEALACGTPVIASGMGSVPEIIQDGKTGFIVSSINQMIKKVDEISKISRRTCRKYVEKNFTQEKMISEHIKAYKEVIKRYKKEKKK